MKAELPSLAPQPRSMDLSGAVALVTGGAGDIGRAVIEQLRAAGARVISADLEHPAASKLDESHCDVTQPGALKELVERIEQELGQLDFFVHCAGITRDGVLWKLSDEDWRSVQSVNLDAAFYGLRAAAPLLRKSERAAVVMISSINAQRGKFGQSNYAASKAGLIGLAKSAAREFARDGVRVNVVAPGFIETSMTAALPGAVKQRALDETLMGRAGQPVDVAGAVHFLCSSLAGHITGQVLRVDGGQLL